jgi:hypothetical protein
LSKISKELKGDKRATLLEDLKHMRRSKCMSCQTADLLSCPRDLLDGVPQRAGRGAVVHMLIAATTSYRHRTCDNVTSLFDRRRTKQGLCESSSQTSPTVSCWRMRHRIFMKEEKGLLGSTATCRNLVYSLTRNNSTRYSE